MALKYLGNKETQQASIVPPLLLEKGRVVENKEWRQDIAVKSMHDGIINRSTPGKSQEITSISMFAKEDTMRYLIVSGESD